MKLEVWFEQIDIMFFRTIPSRKISILGSSTVINLIQRLFYFVDEVDFSICRSLFENSRQPFSKLAKSTGLTPQAVHRRVQDLIQANVINGTVARPTTQGMGRTWVLVHGWSKGRSIKEVGDRLETNPDMMVMMISSGNYLYMHGAVLSMNDLASFVTFVQREAAISDPTVGILNIPQLDPNSVMTPLDLRLLNALRSDTRRPVSEVAEEVGISVKTVKKRLDRLQNEGLAQFSIHWLPDTLGDTISNVHLTLKNGVEREKVAVALINRCSPYIMRTMAFSNIPNQIIVTMWTKNVKTLQQICADLEDVGLFESVLPNVMLNIRYYEGTNSKKWMESMPVKHPRSIK